MKILYLTTWDFINEKSDGVCKKIRWQIKAFRAKSIKVDCIYVRGNSIVLETEERKVMIVGYVGRIKKTPTYFKLYSYLKESRYDCVYNRYGMMDPFYYRVLRQLKTNGARIIVEIPTFPYEGECGKGTLLRFMLLWDKFYRSRMSRVVDRIVTYSKDKSIWGIETIRVRNGIDFGEINPRKVARNTSQINLLAVALMQPYHGFERLLLGLKYYYESGGTRDVVFHLVGDGPEAETYKHITAEIHLKDRIIFYGRKSGVELDELYDRADVGICSLGTYKKGVFLSSELKSREYLAKGLPIVTGVHLDIMSDDIQEYILEFSNCDVALDVQKIIDFYDRIYEKDQEEVISRIRETAKKKIDINYAMEPVVECIVGS